MGLSWDALSRHFPSFRDVDRWRPTLERHLALVQEWNPRVGLTALSPEEAIRRNYGESLELWRLVTAVESPSTVVDVGPGAGYPGVVIAAVAPSVTVHLVEPLQKRASFLETTVLELELSNARIHRQRAEEAGRGELRGAADVVVARAVAPLRELLEYVAPFARVGGLLALAKGSGVGAELEAAANAIAELGCEFVELSPMRPEVSATPWLALFRQGREVPGRYPRRAGIPSKRPL